MKIRPKHSHQQYGYQPPLLQSGELRTPVTFFEYEEHEGPMPGENKKKTLFECFCKIDELWLKDVETAKTNGTLNDITIIIRNPYDSFTPTNKHYLQINHLYHENNDYQIKHVGPDAKDPSFINIVAEVTEP